MKQEQLTSIVILLSTLFVFAAVGQATTGDQIDGYIVPLQHQDIGYTGVWEETLDEMVECLTQMVPRLEEHPDWRFWYENVYPLRLALARHPEYTQRVKKLLASQSLGVGAQWICIDAALAPGESMVRTVTMAKRWMMENLDYEPKVAAMNDMSGFGPQMAQVYAKTNVPFFSYTRGGGPRHFRCVALDGSQVLASNMINYGYAGEFEMLSGHQDEEIDAHWREAGHRLVERHGPLDPNRPVGRVLWGMACGARDNAWPDLSVVEGLMNQWNRMDDPVMRRVHFQFGSLDNIAERLLDASKDMQLPTHTFYIQPWPVQARHERTFEALSRGGSYLLIAEKLSSLVELLGLASYPQQEIDSIWGEDFLLVYDHNWGGKKGGADRGKLAAARRGLRRSEALVTAKLQALASAIRFDRPRPIVVFNPLNWNRTDVVKLTAPLPHDGFVVTQGAGDALPTIIEPVGDGKHQITFVARDVPSMGYRTFYLAEESAKSTDSSIEIGRDRVENEFFRLIVGKDRGIESIYDKSMDRELVAGTTTQWFGQIIAEDVSKQREGWLDGDPFLDETGVITDLLKILAIKVQRHGNWSASVTLEGRIEQSPVTMQLRLYAGIRRIDCRLELDYAGVSPRLLYTALPFGTGAQPLQTIGVGYGAIANPEVATAVREGESPTMPGFSRHSRSAIGHVSTGWTDPTRARFAQKWTDLTAGDGSWGVSLVLRHNHSPVYRRGSTLYIGLVRSLEGHDADVTKKGYHGYEFSIIPHRSNWQDAKAYRAGWEGSAPLVATAPGPHTPVSGQRGLPDSFSLLATNKDNLVVSVLKKSMDGQAYILRGYEASDSDGTVGLSFDPRAKWSSIRQVDLMEQGGKSVPISKGAADVAVRGYEIKTLRLERSTVR